MAEHLLRVRSPEFNLVNLEQRIYELGNWQLEGLPFIQKVHTLIQNTDGAMANVR